MQKVGSVLLDNKLSMVGLLDVVVPSLLVGKVDGGLLVVELHLCGLPALVLSVSVLSFRSILTCNQQKTAIR